MPGVAAGVVATVAVLEHVGYSIRCCLNCCFEKKRVDLGTLIVDRGAVGVLEAPEAPEGVDFGGFYLAGILRVSILAPDQSLSASSCHRDQRVCLQEH